MNTQIEIPIKKVTVAQVVKSRFSALKTKVKGVNFIGTEYFFLKEEIASKGFLNRIGALKESREINGNAFEYFLDGYKFTDNDVEHYKISSDNLIIILDTGRDKLGKIGLNYNYYSYFKKLGAQLKFKDRVSPIGLFKDNEFIGVVLPIRIKEEN